VSGDSGVLWKHFKFSFSVSGQKLGISWECLIFFWKRLLLAEKRLTKTIAFMIMLGIAVFSGYERGWGGKLEIV
jgi:hypothetical protein